MHLATRIQGVALDFRFNYFAVSSDLDLLSITLFLKSWKN